MRKIIVIAILLSLTTAVVAQQNSVNKYSVEKDNYYEWMKWSDEQKSFYIWGVLSGAWAMASDLSYNSGYVDLLRMAEDLLPPLQVRDYRVAVDWIYEMDEMKEIPVATVIFRLEQLLEIRRERAKEEGHR